MAVANCDHGRRIKHEGGSELTLEQLGESWNGYLRPNIPTIPKGRATCRDYHIRKFRDSFEQNMQQLLSYSDSYFIFHPNLIQFLRHPFSQSDDSLNSLNIRTFGRALVRYQCQGITPHSLLLFSTPLKYSTSPSGHVSLLVKKSAKFTQVVEVWLCPSSELCQSSSNEYNY